MVIGILTLAMPFARTADVPCFEGCDGCLARCITVATTAEVICGTACGALGPIFGSLCVTLTCMPAYNKVVAQCQANAQVCYEACEEGAEEGC